MQRVVIFFLTVSKVFGFLKTPGRQNPQAGVIGGFCVTSQRKILKICTSEDMQQQQKRKFDAQPCAITFQSWRPYKEKKKRKGGGKGQFHLSKNWRLQTRCCCSEHITQGGTPNKLLGSLCVPFVQVVCLCGCVCVRSGAAGLLWFSSETDFRAAPTCDHNLERPKRVKGVQIG